MKALLRTLMAFLCCTAMAEAQTQTKGSFSTQLTYNKNYGYILQSPNDKKTRKPLIVFLHGSGEKGTNLEKVKAHGPLKYAASHPLDAYVLAPQCPDDDYWDPDALYQLIQKIQNENAVDAQRIYLTGLSMGAWGAWNLAIAHPETFAAIVPICGFVDRVPMIENCKLAHIPIRVFHGLLDDVVDVSYSTSIYKKIKSCPDSQITLTIFDDANHDAWTRVYDNEEIYRWMFQQTQKAYPK